MLTGIKTGKRKKKKEESTKHGFSSVGEVSAGTSAAAAFHVESSSKNDNLSVAKQLRQSFAAGIAPQSNHNDDNMVSTMKSLEQRGKIKLTDSDNHQKDENSTTVVVLPPGGSATAAHKKEDDMSIRELLAHEKSTASMSLSEQEARSAFRLGKKRRMKDRAAIDSDEEEERQQVNFRPEKKPEKAVVRERARQIAKQDKQDSITSACWWWIESNRFRRHRLIALGNLVSLVMAPPSRSLIPGQHFYIVPIQHSPSLTACDENVWIEIRKFQSSLRSLCQAESKGVIFFETILPSKGFWQTRFEAVIVPNVTIVQDAPLFFKTALTEQAEEWGTHQKLLKTDTTKDLRRTIPKNFSYFYVEYGNDGSGYVQLIEKQSFPKDFGIDTIGGIMQMDPVRFRRRSKDNDEEERKLVLKFLESWKKFDWTLELDAEAE